MPLFFKQLSGAYLSTPRDVFREATQRRLVIFGFVGLSLLFLTAEVRSEGKNGDNIRIGDLSLNLEGSLTQIYDSNIAFAADDPESDWISQLGLSLGGALELTDINELRLSIGAEYRKYWENPQYDSNRNFIILTPESEFELLVKVSNFDFRLYNNFSLLSDPGDQRFVDPNVGSQLSNIVLYNRVRNRLGLDMIWTINPYWNANAGISRRDVFPLDDQFQSLQRHSYLGSLGLTHNMAANLDVYSQLNVSIDRWRTDFQPDSWSQTAGVGADWKPTNFLESKIFIAWTQRSFGDNGTNQDPTRDANGLSGNIELIHLINANLQHSLRYNKSIDAGSISNKLDVQRVEYRIEYSGFERSDLFLGVFWDEGAESGSISPEQYNRWAFRTGLGYPLSPKLAFSSIFEHTFRDSNIQSRNFSRNRVSLKLTYSF